MLFALINDHRDHLLFQVLQVDESDENIFAGDGGFVPAPVDTGQVNGGSPPPGLIEIDPGAVKSPEVIDDCCHKFKGVVDLQVEGLETLHGKGCGVRLGKRVSCK